MSELSALFLRDLHVGLGIATKATQHRHSRTEISLSRPGRVGTFLVDTDGSRTSLVWRSTRYSG